MYMCNTYSTKSPHSTVTAKYRTTQYRTLEYTEYYSILIAHVNKKLVMSHYCGVELTSMPITVTTE